MPWRSLGGQRKQYCTRLLSCFKNSSSFKSCSAAPSTSQAQALSIQRRFLCTHIHTHSHKNSTSFHSWLCTKHTHNNDLSMRITRPPLFSPESRARAHIYKTKGANILLIIKEIAARSKCCALISHLVIKINTPLTKRAESALFHIAPRKRAPADAARIASPYNIIYVDSGRPLSLSFGSKRV